LLEAAVTGASGRAAQCEPLRVPPWPLDVLCQHLLGMAAAGAWSPDDAYRLVRRAHPYRELPRRDFDDCLGYLSGGAAPGGPRAWPPGRLRWRGGHLRPRDGRPAPLAPPHLGATPPAGPRP